MADMSAEDHLAFKRLVFNIFVKYCNDLKMNSAALESLEGTLIFDRADRVTAILRNELIVIFTN